MPTEVKLPHLGESIDSAVVVAWHKSAGDGVKRGDELADLETDKATLSLEAPKNGVLLAIVADEGKTVYIGDLLAVIGRDGESWSAAPEADEENRPIFLQFNQANRYPLKDRVHRPSTKFRPSPVVKLKISASISPPCNPPTGLRSAAPMLKLLPAHSRLPWKSRHNAALS